MPKRSNVDVTPEFDKLKSLDPRAPYNLFLGKPERLPQAHKR
jgi:hypothetical protein